jgi:transcription elongation factor Elf1
MSVFLDRKYLLLVSSRLERFTQKNDDLFNFRCPLCGDSQKNKLKTRGYIYRKNNDYFYMCHNCHVSTTFSKFLKQIDSETHRQYTIDRYTSGDNSHSNYKKPVFSLQGEKPSEKFSEKIIFNNIKLDSIDKLPENHYARQYIEDREIPKKYWSEIFYSECFKDFLDKTFKDHGKNDIPNDDRIVLFYTNKNGEITNVAGRALGDSKIRYCTVKISDEKKIFGLHRVQKSNKVYVFEGQFDSLFIENSVASGDSNLCGVGAILTDCEIVLVYDNEPRNKEIVKQIERAVNSEYNVCLFPESVQYKDINEMICGGMTAKEIKTIIDENTFSGLTAKLKFIEWRKC